MYAADSGYDCERVKSPDRDVFWILLHHSATINCQILFETGHGSKRRVIDITKLANHYGAQLCPAYLGLDVFIGCDSASAFKGRGKVFGIEGFIKITRVQ